jgi:hypothetical protein
MSEMMVRIRSGFNADEINHANRIFKPHRDGCFYVPPEALEPLLHVGGFFIEDAPDLPPNIASALAALLAELAGADREIVAEVAEQIERVN